MPRTIEFRVPFPCSTEEYQLGQIYMVAKMCSEMTDAVDGAGVESIVNEKCNLEGHGEGVYTKKYYHFRSRLPGYVRAVTPSSATFMQEDAWNCFPYAKTLIRHPSFTKFGIEIVTIHAPAKRDASGKIIYEENIHKLGQAELKKRKVKVIDIGDSSDIKPADYKAGEDPATFRPTKGGKGMLTPGWMEREETIMVAYKLLTISCTYFGISGIVEDFLEGYEYGLFKQSHRKFFCWINDWFGLSKDEIREYEARVNKEMTERMRKSTKAGPVGESAIKQALENGKIDDLATSSNNLPDPDA